MKYLLALILFALVATVDAHSFVRVAYVDTDMNIDAPFNAVLTDDSTSGMSFEVGHSFVSVPWLWSSLEYTEFGDVNGGGVNYDAKGLTFWTIGERELFHVFGKPLHGNLRLGVNVLQSTASFGGLAFDDTGLGMAYGAGLRLDIVGDLSVTLDYRKYDADVAYLLPAKLDPATVQLGLRLDF